jgi:hypothetical protein
MSETYLRIRRHWNEPGTRVRRGDLAGLYRDSTTRLPRARSRPLVTHGLVACDAVLEGELGHSCAGATRTRPHLLQVCVLPADNEPSVFAEVLAAAGPSRAEGRDALHSAPHASEAMGGTVARPPRAPRRADERGGES